MPHIQDPTKYKEVVIESFWGAIATLFLYQLFGYIIFQAFLYYQLHLPYILFGGIWIFAFLTVDAITINKIRDFLQNTYTQSPLQQLKQIDDLIKAILATLFFIILLLFLAGYYPFPQYPYDLPLLISYFIISWIISYLISRMLQNKKPKIKISSDPKAIPMGLLIGGSFFIITLTIAPGLFYLHGMIGLGIILLVSSSVLLKDQIKIIT